MTREDPRVLHVLHVAWQFAPEQGPGAARSLATVTELVRLGHRVTVLTADLATADLVTVTADLATADLVTVTADLAAMGERSLLNDVPDAVRVVRVAMAPRQRDPLINRWPAGRLADPKGWTDTAESEQVRAFPEAIYAPWQPRAEAAANRIQELDPIDLVIAAGEPYVDFSVALRLNVDHGVPFVLDDRGALNDGGDSEERGGWLTDVPAEDQSPLDKRVLTWLEFALSTALSVWFVNPLVADRHRDHFPSSADRIRVVDDVGEALPTALQDAASALTS